MEQYDCMFDSTDPEAFASSCADRPAGADEALGMIAAGLEMLRSEDRAGWSSAARSDRVLELGGLLERVHAETRAGGRGVGRER